MSKQSLDISALRLNHDPVARNLATVWRWQLHALLDIALAAREFAEPTSTADHAALNVLLDRWMPRADLGRPPTSEYYSAATSREP